MLDEFKNLFMSKRYAASILSLGDYQDVVWTNSYAFDAMIASLTARAAALGLTSKPEADEVHAAKTEGWIRVPAPGSLEQLVGQ